MYTKIENFNQIKKTIFNETIKPKKNLPVIFQFDARPGHTSQCLWNIKLDM